MCLFQKRVHIYSRPQLIHHLSATMKQQVTTSNVHKWCKNTAPLLSTTCTGTTKQLHNIFHSLIVL